MIGHHNKFLEELDLDPIGTLSDSFSMRRQTIQANCGIMEGKLDDEYKQFEAANQEYVKRSTKLQDTFMNTAETFQNAKSYYDVSFMYSALQELKADLLRVEKLEATVISQTNDVNSKVGRPHPGLRTRHAVQRIDKRASPQYSQQQEDHVGSLEEWKCWLKDSSRGILQ